MPFPIRAIQVDGGSEFEDAFEEEGQNTIPAPPDIRYLSPKEFLECYQQHQREAVMCH
jgi:hypothetical protein